MWSSSRDGNAAMNDLYIRFGKRIFDASFAALALFVLSPLFLILVVLVKVSSAGPVFYRQERVGKNGRSFKIAKFRSMYANAERIGLPITRAGDPRVTWIGRLLRAGKLDELPQLWNVLKGEMSLVGPRPEVLRYVTSYSPEQREVLSILPGLTDPASIAYRDEEKLLGIQVDPELYYREVVLPHKLDLNREYIRRMSFSYDVYLVLRTIGIVLIPNLQRAETLEILQPEGEINRITGSSAAQVSSPSVSANHS
jgi:lipopolysaccharide/colanic/teichoic acid biosynthesis glycosyltransferase